MPRFALYSALVQIDANKKKTEGVRETVKHVPVRIDLGSR